MTVTVEIPIKLPSASNLREHWGTKARRVKSQRAATRLALVSAYNKLGAREFLIDLPVVVTLTRVYGGRGSRAFDDDNLRGAFKAVRDAVAEFWHMDDADPRIEWRYVQAKGRAAVRIELAAVWRDVQMEAGHG